MTPDGCFLIDRQSHHSLPLHLARVGCEWEYIAANGWDPVWEVPEPVTAAAVAQAICGARRLVACVSVTSPSYAGESADLAAIVAIVRELAPDAGVHVDQAWGAHEPWMPPGTIAGAMRAGADTASLSLHKQGGSCQPGAGAVARAERLPRWLLFTVHGERVSTSQSLHIAGSVDASQRSLSEHGDEAFTETVRLTRLLKQELRRQLRLRRLPSLRFLDEERSGPHDPTKLTVSLAPYQISGYQLGQELQERDVVAEKASIGTLTFLVTLRVTDEDIDTAAERTADILAQAGPRQGRPPRLANPNELCEPRPALSPTVARQRSYVDGELVPAAEAVGRIAAEKIEVYPPGIPLVFYGFRITRDVLAWLGEVESAGGAIHRGAGAERGPPETVRVLREDRL